MPDERIERGAFAGWRRSTRDLFVLCFVVGAITAAAGVLALVLVWRQL